MPDPNAFPVYNDDVAWGRFVVARYSKCCLWVYGLCAVVCVGATLLIKLSKNVSAEGLGER